MPYPTSAPIAAKYAKVKASLGAPVKPEVAKGGGRYQEFAKGIITWNGKSSSPAYALTGPILTRYRSFGIGTGSVGWPTSDVTATVSGRTKVSFERGLLFAKGSTVTDVRGQTLTLYRTLNAEKGVLGVPTVSSKVSGKSSQVQFAHGTVVTTSKGAYYLLGTVAQRYAKHGSGAGDLGLPLSNPTKSGSVTIQQFTHARLDLSKAGALTVRVKLNASVSTVTKADLKYSYRAGCPVGPAQLRRIRMNHLNYDGVIKRGELIVNKSIVTRTIKAFSSAAWASFPIARMQPVEAYQGSDPKSMAANNTSGFNCRQVVGKPSSLSPHAYGTAIDINTRQNPYFDGRTWWPYNGTYWITHRSGKGVLTGKDPMAKAMMANGFIWGGKWIRKDWHHFQR